MGTPAAEQAITDVQQGPHRPPRQRRSPGAQPGSAPAPEGGVQARDPGAVVESGVQYRLHLLTAKSECTGVKTLLADVDEQQLRGGCGGVGVRGSVRTQELDLPRAKRAVTVEVQREWPLLFLVHLLGPVQVCATIGANGAADNGRDVTLNTGHATRPLEVSRQAEKDAYGP